VDPHHAAAAMGRVVPPAGAGGRLGKTNLGEALIHELCPGGYWFVDDPDDFRELEGHIQPGQGIVVDEIALKDYTVNQVKKLYDVEKARRVKCRHFNGTIPEGCPRIFSTNSDMEGYYPKMKNKHDRTGIMRRQLFQTVRRDVRLCARASGLQSNPTVAALPAMSAGPAADWHAFLACVCQKAAVSHLTVAVCDAALELGVAFCDELADVGDDIASEVCMKPLERIRFLCNLRV
jgi:hypothetical protein